MIPKLNTLAFTLSLVILLIADSTFASIPEYARGKTGKTKAVTAGCKPPVSSVDLDVNNIRCRILIAGDMWWDLENARYEVPKVDPNSGQTSLNSIFAGALWFGGIDAGGQLKVAALAYRVSYYGGDEFYPGPLDADAAIDEGECAFWDYHFKITRAEVDSFLSTGNASDAILNWPGYGNTITIKNTTKTLTGNTYTNLAPFEDVNGDGIYNPYDGDFPRYDVNKQYNCKTEDLLFGDQSIWWVFNDKGNVHGNSEGAPIGLQVNSQAFAFATSDEVNNMTFYDYTIYNKSSVTLNKFYMAQYVDADLGHYDDDYVGCDVARGLGFVYNGDADDEGGIGYGLNPPALGLDFFRGPLADEGDLIDNDLDGTVDEEGEEIIMSNYMYFSKVAQDAMSDPDKSTDFYGYMSGFWKDGTPVTYGGTGYGGTEPAKYMFPWDTDPSFPGQPWSEEGNAHGDRRFVQSAGPFTLKPGAVNKITIGVVWARASAGEDQLKSVELMKTADDKAQALFDNCFQILDGPDAPQLGIIELDNELILTINNPTSSNNYNEGYKERDPTIDAINYPNDTSFIFQGYQIYQAVNASVSTDELDDVTRVQLVAQFDIKDNIDKLINYEYDQDVGADVPEVMVSGDNEGISHSVSITEDKFATGDDKLVNFKRYHFLAVAYAANNFKDYDPANVNDPGQKKPYLLGRKSAGGSKITAVTGIPHKPKPQYGGTGIGAQYGEGPEITQIQGYGNSGNELDLSQTSVDVILATNSISKPVYQGGKGPVKVTVVDPVNVPNADFKIVIYGDVDTNNQMVDTTTRWYLVNLTDKDTVFSDTTIHKESEQLLLNVTTNINSSSKKNVNWGLAVSINQVTEPGVDMDEENGIITVTKTYEDESKQWLSGISDQDGQEEFYNWIRAGESTTEGWLDHGCIAGNDSGAIDPKQAYEGLLGATWAPYHICSDVEVTDNNAQLPIQPITYNHQPAAWDYSTAFNQSIKDYYRGVPLKGLANVDVVLTSDQSKWTRCVVIELGEDALLNEGNAEKFDLRKHASWDKKYDSNGDPVYETDGSTGYSWFPGYAIDVDKGIRLDIIFGESSWDQAENGADMLWNPTSVVESKLFQVFGAGRHWIYIMNSQYDEATSSDYYHTRLNAKNDDDEKRNVYNRVHWVSLAALTEGEELLSNEVKVRLRVNNAYQPTTSDNKLIYTFSTSKIAASKSNADSAKSALDMINIVPNPYYAFSAYETSQVDNRVKFINLPDKVNISIYTVSGTLVRKLEKEDDTATYIDWDLKNTVRVPVSSGIYIIHFEVPGVGDKIMKWFGVMRPIDLDTF